MIIIINYHFPAEEMDHPYLVISGIWRSTSSMPRWLGYGAREAAPREDSEWGTGLTLPKMTYSPVGKVTDPNLVF